MKTLIALMLLAFSGAANAEKDVTIPNGAGGEITFTFLKGACGDSRFIAYATNKSGELVARGCWLYDVENEKAFIRWQDGTLYEYK